MWPAYKTKFETPDIGHIVAFKKMKVKDCAVLRIDILEQK